MEMESFRNIDKCWEDNIFAVFDESDITNAYAMIIGPDDTPYQGGFFFFKVKFSDTYPFTPPHVLTITQSNDSTNIRFNPNLYTANSATGGKVCLSILGTWSGPGWSPLYNLRKIMIAIMGQVLTETPLYNEPGYETRSKDDPEVIAYSNVVRYATCKYAIAKMLDGTNIPVPESFKTYFSNIMKEYFTKNRSKYMNYIDNLISKNNNKTYSCSYSNQKITSDYKHVKNILEKI